MSQRTPTPDINRIWSTQAEVDRWMNIWIQHLRLQMEHNPNHPGHQQETLDAYQSTRDRLNDRDEAHWLQFHHETLREEFKTRHDLVAVLNVFNRHACRDAIHLGLTSSDVTETAQQIAVLDSLERITGLVESLQDQLLRSAVSGEQNAVRMVGRTHGQPAQLTTVAYRAYASTVQALGTWARRLDSAVEQYWMRFPGGAVGTGADLQRVLEGWGRGPRDTQLPREIEDGTPTELQHYADQLATRLGFNQSGLVGRQTGDRIQDLHLVGSMVELSLIARQWATDRRLEVMLGHGQEAHEGPDQVGSSAMPHKHNPILCERVVALSSLTPGYYAQMATMGTNEWLEGDVSTSAARRKLWPQLFQTVAEMLVNWSAAIEAWEPDRESIAADVQRHRSKVATGAWLQLLVERGFARTTAHEILRRLGDDLTSIGDLTDGQISVAELVQARLEVLEGPMGRAITREDL